MTALCPLVHSSISPRRCRARPNGWRFIALFFERCRAWLSERGALSLQTIVYGDMDASEANGFITTEIFPQAELPRPQEILAATDRLFEVVSYRNDRLDYARTCETWLTNLRAARKRSSWSVKTCSSDTSAI